MKLRFTPPETEWLDTQISKLIALTHRDESDAGNEMNRCARKMKYKFAGHPSLVFLGARERDLLSQIASVRLNTIGRQATPETEIVVGIARTLLAVHKGEAK